MRSSCREGKGWRGVEAGVERLGPSCVVGAELKLFPLGGGRGCYKMKSMKSTYLEEMPTRAAAGNAGSL